MTLLSKRLEANKGEDESTNQVLKLKKLRDYIKAKQKEERDLTDELSKQAVKYGQKDGKGNRSFKQGDYILIRQRIEKAVEVDEIPCYKLFKAKGFPKPYKVETIRVFDEDVYNQYADKLTDDEKEQILIIPEPSFRVHIKHANSSANSDEF